MFDAEGDVADERAFTERCADDRHHFRFTIAPEDGAELEDLKAFTRDVVRDAEKDLGTRLDWIAVDHWNTDNPHVHLLVRGRSDDGKDLVISRYYMSHGFRERASERATLELGPRSELEIQASLLREVDAERWTSLDRALVAAADDGGGVADLRPLGRGQESELQRLLRGRAATLESLGLADQVGPARWTLAPELENTLRDLAIRGDVVKTMHKAMGRGGRDVDLTAFEIHQGEPAQPVLGRLVDRGLDDELKGSAYAVVEGVDGRTHHLKFGSLEMTGDAVPGAVVESRSYNDASATRRLSLAVRSDLSIEAQTTADGATWLDHQLLAKDKQLSAAGFGREVTQAMTARVEHLVGAGLADREGGRVRFSRDLLATLRAREIDAAEARIAVETGLNFEPTVEGDRTCGVYRRRITLASGRFALIEDGVSFQLVPWRPALETKLGVAVSGIVTRDGVEWNLSHKRGLGI